jgi:hypothetical protein
MAGQPGKRWIVPTYQVRQIIPAVKMLAVYKLPEGGLCAEPVIAWGVCHVTEQCFYLPDGSPPGTCGRPEGAPESHDSVYPLVLSLDTGTLDPPQEADNFLGVCGAADDPKVVFKGGYNEVVPPAGELAGAKDAHGPA